MSLPFPRGAYADEATRRLAAVQPREESSWSPEERRLPVTIRPTLEGLANDATARADALARGEREAMTLCRSYASDSRRVISARVDPRIHEWRCSSRGNGVACGFDGEVVCSLEVQQVVTRSVCP
jgi:hypothetical protein